MKILEGRDVNGMRGQDNSHNTAILRKSVKYLKWVGKRELSLPSNSYNFQRETASIKLFFKNKVFAYFERRINNIFPEFDK